MGRFLALLYGAVCYMLFFGTFLYFIYFVWMLETAEATVPMMQALMVNAGLLALFAIQHSVMARQGFKKAWTKFVPQPVERATYVAASSVVTLLMIQFWQPISGTVWSLEAGNGRLAVQGLFFGGVLLVLFSTFLIDHFELFGLKQVWTHFNGKSFEPPAFKMPAIYKFVRHPLYLGWITFFWSAPVMTYDRLVLAIGTTAYILIAIQLEEKDLISVHGEDYKVYRSGVSMLVPWPSKKKPAA